MDASFLLAAAIFTLLAIVLATSLFTGTSPSSDYGRRVADSVAAKERSWAGRQNGHVPCSPPGRKQRRTEKFDWCEMSGSSHDHWDVVKNVQSDEEQLASDLSRPSSCASSGRGSYIHLTETELLKCAFPGSQTEDSLDYSDKAEPNHYWYLPGKSRSHHLQMRMSKDELEEEQRVQREQLAAIFQLLKNNKETFGEVSQGDMGSSSNFTPSEQTFTLKDANTEGLSPRTFTRPGRNRKYKLEAGSDRFCSNTVNDGEC
ncbi:hypothetical protein WMY93_010127 [Mugilogobius chulae]|uniref:Matrix-remodeling-associated protein 7 helical domain-containing protein n=1 Tax=Mugilogobius chulae TaxID=88201 RepID=A0AAW0PIU2_9GOBI